MYKPLSDSTLMSMTKKEIIENLRIAEHNFFAAEETLAQQAENMRDWAPVVHGKWAPSERNPSFLVCSVCGDCYVYDEWVDERKWRYCPACGAKMDGKDEEA